MPKQRRQPARPAGKRPSAKKTSAKAKAPAAPAAKSRKAPARPAKQATGKAVKRPALPVGKEKKRPGNVAPPAKPAVAGPSSHELAVETFERGFEALQQRQFGRAAELLAKVVDGFPDEKEMQERARVYLSICERQKNSRASAPKSLEERLNAATVAINRGAFTEGLALLRKLEDDYPENDHIQYMLCVAYTVLGDGAHALQHLKQAVSLNHENRYLASQDADLDPLRQDPAFAAALDALPAPRAAKAATRKR